MRLRRLIPCLLTSAALLGLCVLLATQYPTTQLDFNLPLDLIPSFGRGCPDLKDLRRHLELPSTIRFAKRTIWLTPVDALLPTSVVKVNQNLIPNFDLVNLKNGQCASPELLLEEDKTNDITIEFLDEPAQPRNDTSSLLIGLSTTFQRFESALPQLKRWLADTDVSLVASIQGAQQPRMLKVLERKVNDAGMNAMLIDAELSNPRNAQDEITTLELLHNHRKEHHKWFAIIEHDSFLTSISNLMEALKPYSPNKMWYLGALSEDWNVVSAGPKKFMAATGAGIIISAPLLDRVHGSLDTCHEVHSNQRDCVFAGAPSQVRMTELSGLHQLDIAGDMSGWYESGVSPVLSLHNRNGLNRYPIELGHLVTEICGNECFLQRYQFADNVVLTNGYSMTQYLNGMSNIDLDKVEGTFSNVEGQYDFSLGPLRPKLSASEKASWRLEYASKDFDGSIKQFYVRRKVYGKNDDERMKSEIESVFELEWKL